MVSEGFHPELCHLVVFCGQIYFGSFFAQIPKSCRLYLIESNRGKLLCEHFVAIISKLKMLKRVKDYATYLVHFILAGLFLKAALITLSAIRGEYLSSDFNQKDNINRLVE